MRKERTYIASKTFWMKSPTFNGLCTRAFNWIITCPAQWVVELMIVSLAIGCIFKHVKGIIREFFMTNLANDMSKTSNWKRTADYYLHDIQSIQDAICLAICHPWLKQLLAPQDDYRHDTWVEIGSWNQHDNTNGLDAPCIRSFHPKVHSNGNTWHGQDDSIFPLPWWHSHWRR